MSRLMLRRTRNAGAGNDGSMRTAYSTTVPSATGRNVQWPSSASRLPSSRRTWISRNGSRRDSAAAFAADLTDVAAIEQLAAQVGEWRSRLDVLVNNASSFYPTPAGTITEAQWDDLVGTNLKAPLFLSQAALPRLRDAGGVIVNIIDVHSSHPLRDHPVYGPAKAGLAMLTRSLAKDLAPDVRVNGVSPGAILWPENDMPDDTKAAILKQVPLARPGDPEDIAGAVLFLVRDATYVTGQVIAVDGGRSIGW